MALSPALYTLNLTDTLVGLSFNPEPLRRDNSHSVSLPNSSRPAGNAQEKNQFNFEEEKKRDLELLEASVGGTEAPQVRLIPKAADADDADDDSESESSDDDSEDEEAALLAELEKIKASSRRVLGNSARPSNSASSVAQLRGADQPPRPQARAEREGTGA